MAVIEVLSMEDVVEVFRDVDPASVDADFLALMALGSQSIQNWIEGCSAVWLAEFAQRGSWAADGSRSMAAWVEERTHAPARRVAAQAKLGRVLHSMPVTRAAVQAGELSQPHLRLLASCRTEATAELFDEDEAQLVGWATMMRLPEFKQVVRVWAAHADPDDITVGEPDLVKEGQLFLSESLNGCWILKGTLDPEQGRIVAAAVNAEVDRLLRAKHDGDPTHAERLISEIRAEALVNVITQTMRKEPSERSVQDRYRVAVILNPGDNTDRVELCDCALYRVVRDATGAVLDVSHATRNWPDAIRLAVTIRDEHCVFPGCDGRHPAAMCITANIGNMTGRPVSIMGL